MIQSRHRNWVCVAVVVGAVSYGGSSSAQPPPPTTEEEREQPAACADTCESRCNCRNGINVTDYKNLILLNFGSTLAGRIELEYERALHRRVSIFGAAYVVAFDSVGNEKLVGFGGLLGPRVYLVGGAPEGLWLAWAIGGVYRNPRGNRKIKLRAVQTGLMLGWTWVWRRLAITLGAGANYTYGRVQVDDQSVKEGEWNPWFKGGIGVAFGHEHRDGRAHAKADEPSQVENPVMTPPTD